jgi:hypothetical protein
MKLHETPQNADYSSANNASTSKDKSGKLGWINVPSA